MASKGTEFTSEAKSEANASAAKCPVDHGAVRSRPGGCTQRPAYQS